MRSSGAEERNTGPQLSALDLAMTDAGTLLRSTRSALLLVDVINRFLDPAADETGSNASITEHLRTLLTLARERNLPRAFVTVRHFTATIANDSASWLRRAVDISGPDPRRALSQPIPAWDEEVVAPLTPRPDEPHFHKYRLSAFYNTPLELYLHSQGVETLIIGGVASYGCIVASCIDANCRGFSALVPVEGTGGADPVLHEAAMKIIGPSSVTNVRTIADVWRSEMEAGSA